MVWNVRSVCLARLPKKTQTDKTYRINKRSFSIFHETTVCCGELTHKVPQGVERPSRTPDAKKGCPLRTAFNALAVLLVFDALEFLLQFKVAAQDADRDDGESQQQKTGVHIHNDLRSGLHVADAGEIAGEDGDGGDEDENGLDDHDEIPYG